MEVAVIEVTLTLSWPGNGNIGLETERIHDKKDRHNRELDRCAL